MKGQEGRRGWTLIELVLTLVLLAILAAAARPYLQGVGGARSGSAARKLLSDVRHAKELAMGGKLASGLRTAYGIEFDPAGDRYRVFSVANGINVTDPNTKSVGASGAPWTSGLVVDYPTHPELKGVDLVSTNFDVSGTGNQLRFDSLGRPRNALGALFSSPGQVVVSYQGNSRTLTVQPNTGHLGEQ